jgi:SAM-dependent methyltransferase
VNPRYVHGFEPSENERLRHQADALVDLLHGDTRYPDGATVLEAGCGVGAQTVSLARNSPGARITCIDLSESSLAEARHAATRAGLTNLTFERADILDLPYAPGSFDHVFLCFVLEHLARPSEALLALGRVLAPGGTLTAIEGDHGSAYFHPDSEHARQAIRCQVRLQAEAGGNAMIGRELYPLITGAGFADVRVSPRMVYVDSSRPDLVDAFTKRTFIAMVEGVRATALETGLIEAEAFDRGIADLYAATAPSGVFCYTFFKAVARQGTLEGSRFSGQ